LFLFHGVIYPGTQLLVEKSTGPGSRGFRLDPAYSGPSRLWGFRSGRGAEAGVTP